MSKIVTTSILRITYESDSETPEEIEKRIRKEIENLGMSGKLDCWEKGTFPDSWHLEVSTTRIE